MKRMRQRFEVEIVWVPDADRGGRKWPVAHLYDRLLDCQRGALVPNREGTTAAKALLLLRKEAKWRCEWMNQAERERLERRNTALRVSSSLVRIQQYLAGAMGEDGRYLLERAKGDLELVKRRLQSALKAEGM